MSDPDTDDIARLLRVLADPARLRILQVLAAAETGEVCACDLPAALDRTQSTVSHHLGQLVSAGLITREQRGKWAWFSIDHSRLDQVKSALTGIGQ